MKWHGVVMYSLVVLAIIPNQVIAANSTEREDLWPELSVGYSKKLLPPQQNGPLIVELDMHILSLSAISEKTMDFKINLFLRQRWRDSRLSNNASSDLRLTSVIDELWVPDLFIANDKRSHVADVTVLNAFLDADKDGNIVYSQRVVSTIACSMNLELYPFDTQHCSVEFESYGLTTDELQFRWKATGKPVEMAEHIVLPEHKVANKDNVTMFNCTAVYSTTGAFSCMGMTFQFDRTVNYYVMSVFLPSVLIVVLSWVSFWIDKESTPGRVSLALLTILTMQTQLSANMSHLPRVSYIKFIDIWLTGCLAFVFAGFLEYALVNKLSTDEKKLKAKLAKEESDEVIQPEAKFMKRIATMDGKVVPLNIENDGSKEIKENESERPGKFRVIGMADRVDHFSRFLFPLTFVVLNIVLWGALVGLKQKNKIA